MANMTFTAIMIISASAISPRKSPFLKLFLNVPKNSPIVPFDSSLTTFMSTENAAHVAGPAVMTGSEHTNHNAFTNRRSPRTRRKRPRDSFKVLPRSINNYPFTPPRATPAMIYFDNAKYITKSGNTERVSPR